MEHYQEILPVPRLARYVECYWARRDWRGTPGHCVLPDGCVDILFSAQGSEPVGLEVVGLMTTGKTIDIKAGQHFFGVRFRPGMAAAFLPDSAKLIDRTEPLENLIGAAAGREIFQKLGEASSPSEMTQVMEGFLRPLNPPNTAEKVLRQLISTAVSVNGLAAQSGLSTRQLRRICLENTGVSPKYLLRILRFRNVAERIGSAATPAELSWALLAADHGYFDQAHFIREFQEFTSFTPGRFLQSRIHADG